MDYIELFNLNNSLSGASTLNPNFEHKHYQKQYKIYDMQSVDTESIIKNSNSPLTDFNMVPLYKAYMDWMYDNYKGEIIVSGSGKIIGYVIIDSTNNIPFNLYIFQRYRGYGFGKTLVQYIIDKYNCDTLEVDMNNRVAIKMYSKFGFRVVDICINCNGNKFYIMKRIIKPITFY